MFRRKWLFRGCAAAIGAALTLLGLEVMLRIHNPIPLPLRGKEIVLPVNTKIVWRREGSATRLDPSSVCSRNRIGFRGPDPPKDFEDHLTILTVGGSTTACAFIADERTWPELLRLRLERSFDKLWLNNAGLDGHSTFGHQKLMEQVVRDLAPRFVTFLVGINEVARDDLTDYDRMSLVESHGMIEKVTSKSELLSTVQVLYRSYRAFDVGVCGNWELDLTTTSRIHLPEEEESRLLQAEKEGAPLAGFRTRLARLLDYTIGCGIEPILITQPSLYGDCIDPTTGLELGTLVHKDRPARLHWKVLELFNDVTRAMGAERRLLVIDLAAELPKDSALFYDWIHYTNLGCEKVAAIVDAHLSAHLRQRGY